jgi:predicted transcriptional regulator
MQKSYIRQWIEKDQSRKKLLSAISRPFTAAALSELTGLRASQCSYILARLAENDFAVCLNPQMQNSRIYGLTAAGEALRRVICGRDDYYCPCIDWNVYGKVCFNHRRWVIKVIDEPMQPAAIKRSLRIRKPQVKISANNVRDTIRSLLKLGIVKPVRIKKKAHLRYELTALGKEIRELL